MPALLVTDLDGTLWDDSEICHPKTLAAVAELEHRGVPLLVATGRRKHGVNIGFEQNGLALPAVLVNGASGFDFRTGTSLFDKKFDLVVIAEIVERLQEAGISPALFTSPDQVVVGPDPTVGPHYVSTIAKGLVQVDDLLGYVDDTNNAILGFVLMSMSEEQLGRTRTVLTELDFDAYSYHLDQYFEGWMVMGQAPGVNKWTGIQRYIDNVPGQVDCIVVVGDSANDIPMFGPADLSVMIEGGSPALAELADVTIGSPSSGGWAAMVDLVAELR